MPEIRLNGKVVILPWIFKKKVRDLVDSVLLALKRDQIMNCVSMIMIHHISHKQYIS